MPRLIARSMFSLGILAALALSIAIRRLKLVSGFPPFSLAAIVIRLPALVKIAPRLASEAAFCLLIVDHLE